MKLAILGGSSQTSKQFVSHATRQGFTIVTATDSDTNAAIAASHAVVCLPDFELDPAILAAIIECMTDHGVPRLVIAGTSLDRHQLLRPVLQTTAVDWTIVQTIDQAEQAIDQSVKSHFLVGAKDLAKFLVNQITDSRYLQTTVLVKS